MTIRSVPHRSVPHRRLLLRLPGLLSAVACAAVACAAGRPQEVLAWVGAHLPPGCSRCLPCRAC